MPKSKLKQEIQNQPFKKYEVRSSLKETPFISHRVSTLRQQNILQFFSSHQILKLL